MAGEGFGHGLWLANLRLAWFCSAAVFSIFPRIFFKLLENMNG